LATKPSHDPRLDGLRAIAVLMVMLFHAQIVPWGGGGVDVFFVLSGWLITGMLQRELDQSGRIDLPGFFARRARRLLPALWLLLVVYTSLSPQLWSHWRPILWIDVIAAALFLSDWREALWKNSGPISHTWSLSVEMQFYLVWPFILMALRPLGRGRAVVVLGVLWLVVTIARSEFIAAGKDDLAYFLGLLHATGLILGGILALRPPAAPAAVGYLGLLGMVALAFAPNTHATLFWRLPAIEAAAAMVVMAPPAWLAFNPLVWLGQISYGVYLWHIPVLKALWGLPTWPRLLAMAVVSVLLASASFVFIEQPIRRWRFRPRLAPAAAPTRSK